jgi:putative flippase GtrA
MPERTKPMPEFFRYACIGVINTAIHACVFAVLLEAASLGQAPANLLGFLAAVSFSYYANARWTFRAPVSLNRYLLFTAFMAALAFASGQLGQWLRWPAPLTFCLFSGVSLSLGFVFARQVAFKEGASRC